MDRIPQQTPPPSRREPSHEQREERKGEQAPDPQKSDLGRTDDVPRETAQSQNAPSQAA